MVRDSEKTKQRILSAVGALLARRGFRGIGVNAVARKAGVDKVLIYRYFGGMPELLRAYARHGDLWPTIRELTQKRLKDFRETDFAELSVALLLGHLRALQERPQTQEIMRWELHQQNELTEELTRVREQQGIELLDLLPERPGEGADLDLPALAAVLQAGLTYLVLRSKTADVYLGIDLRSASGWKRIERAVEKIVRALVAP